MRRPLSRLDVLGFGVLAFVAAVVVGHWAYEQALNRAWLLHNEFDVRSEGDLEVGDRAPDVELTSTGDRRPVRISDLYRERPAVLVFGSYT